MPVEKEKARFAFEILKRFAPHMDHSNEQQERTEALLEQFEIVTESLRDLDETKKDGFRSFMGLFSTYIDEQEQLHTELKMAYDYLSEQTVSLITDPGNTSA
jgi:hypothetical protein